MEIGRKKTVDTRHQSRPTSPSADPITPGPWQGSHWSANVSVTGMTGVLIFQSLVMTECQFFSHWYDSTRKNHHGGNPNGTLDLPVLKADALTTRPTRRSRTNTADFIDHRQSLGSKTIPFNSLGCDGVGVLQSKGDSQNR